MKRSNDRATRSARAAYDTHIGSVLPALSGPTPYWMRYAMPTRPPAPELADLPIGPMTLASNRQVFNTGQLLLGVRHQSSAAWFDQGVHADAVQSLLLDHQLDAARYCSITHVGSSFGARLANAVWWVVAMLSLAALILMVFNVPEMVMP